jgi:hypothetical protein
LRLRSGGREGLIRVDGPVTIRPLRGHLLAVPPFLTRMELGPVIGFCEEEGRVVVLIDVGRVLRLHPGATDAAGGRGLLAPERGTH